MNLMKNRLMTMAALAALVVTGGCGKGKEITSLQRREAETLVSEAQFAVQVKDFARAEGAMTNATALCPDTGSYWIDLGAMRVRLGKKDLARSAYQSGLKAYEAAAAAAPTDVRPMLQQVYVLGLLGRTDDARAVLAKGQKQFPDDRTVRAFAEGKQIDKMIADPRFKEIAL
jgi:Flp pilus assembly protein TadD